MLDIKFTGNFEESAKTIVFCVSDDLKLSNRAMILDQKHEGIISKSLAASDSFTGKFGQAKSVAVVGRSGELHNITLIGLGKTPELSIKKLEELGGTIAGALKSLRVENALIETTSLGSFNSEVVAAHFSFGALLGTYSFNKYFTNKKPEELPILKGIEFFTENYNAAEHLFADLKEVAKGVYLARDLVSEVPNVLYPESYAQGIAEILEPLDVEIEILGEREMKGLGMNALLGVGQGSSRESKLVIMRYNGKDDDSAPIAFIGKGVTFDTGGISLKPSANMHEMKYDMGGSAAVVGAIRALAGRKAKVNVLGVIGLVENMPGGNAQRPGDVVKSMSGQTIEILNTDAEGRLVLADALWYTQDRFKPSLMIDLATLTGAIIISLGNTYAGMFSNNEELASKLLNAGAASGEELWRMPLHADYDKMIKSDIADIANIGTPGGAAGSSTAAQFLAKFVNNLPWAHLDIAGMAWEKKGKPICPKGAAAFGVRLLDKLVSENYEAK